MPAKQKDIEVVKVQESTKVFQLIQRLEVPELCLEERLCIASQMREVLGAVHEHAPSKAISLVERIKQHRTSSSLLN